MGTFLSLKGFMKTPAGAQRARAIYALARPNYHPTAVAALDHIVLGPAR
jgi:hypothetical protein